MEKGKTTHLHSKKRGFPMGKDPGLWQCGITSPKLHGYLTISIHPPLHNQLPKVHPHPLTLPQPPSMIWAAGADKSPC